jgi:hypothetical protein
MRWIEEDDEDHDGLARHTLDVGAGESLETALAAYWIRILNDALAARSDYNSLSFDILDRQIPGDELGRLLAVFRSAPRHPAKHLGTYALRGEVFDLIQPRSESNAQFNRREIRWFLEVYGKLKAAALTAENRPLFEKFAAARPIAIDAATSYGWFDLRIGQDAFGPLPEEDVALLSGGDAKPNPVRDLTAGVVDLNFPSGKFEIE